VVEKFVLEDPECYKDTQMKAYDITKLTAIQKSSDNHQYTAQQINKNIYLCCLF